MSASNTVYPTYPERETSLSITITPALTPSTTPSIPQTHSSFFSNPKQQAEEKVSVNVDQLFIHVSRGEQDELLAILKNAKDPDELRKLLTTKHTLIDYGNRTFKDITLFQLALWYLDRHMWTMLLRFFNIAGMQKEANDQYLDHLSGKLPYSVDNEEHYQFKEIKQDREGILTMLKSYNEFMFGGKYEPASEAMQIVAKDTWIEDVGGVQRRAPLHVIQEYCRTDGPRFTEPLPSTRFLEDDLPRSVEFFNSIKNRKMNFWDRDKPISELGTEIALSNSAPKDNMEVMCSGSIRPNNSREDYRALQRLCLVRMKEYYALGLELEKNLQAQLLEQAAAQPGLSLKNGGV